MKIFQDRSRREHLKVRLDWKAYYLRFCEIHGDPVPYKNQLLFQDGWQYSNMDYAGPEYPPPEDVKELRVLALAYWKVRAKLIYRKLAQVKAKLVSVTNLQSQKSLPLQCPIIYWDDETGRRRVRKPDEARSRDVDTESMLVEHREGVKNLELDLAHCRDKMIELKSEETEGAKQ